MSLLQDTKQLARANALLNKEGDPRAAAQLFMQLLRRRPNDAGVLEGLGVCLIRLGKLDDARKYLTRAVRNQPAPLPYRNLARTYEYQGRAEEAIRTLEKGLKHSPGHPALLGAKADALFLKGDVEGAWRVIERELGPGMDAAFLYPMAKIAMRIGKEAEAIDALRNALREGRVPDANVPLAHFQLAALLDKMGDHDAAFREADEANRLRPLPFDADRFLQDVDRMIAAWTPEVARSVARSSDRSDVPLFIVGIPRSGTSLVEQIIASHPRAFGAGELSNVSDIAREITTKSQTHLRLLNRPELLTQPLVNRMGRKLVTDMRALNRVASRVTDKMPANSFHLGLISSLAPGSRAIHCVRHPLDSCVSCYFQPFPSSVTYAANLEHLAAYYAACHRTIEHWKRVLDYPILDVVYEDLVADFDPRARALIDFVGLEWNDACARFHETRRITATASADQVRRPLYSTSTARWRRYGSHLDPLRKALERYGIEIEE